MAQQFSQNHLTNTKQRWMALAVRKDSAEALSDDGEYIPLIVDANGKLHVNIGTDAVPVSESEVPCSSADVHAPAANTAAVVTYAADATHKHAISGVAWSYAGGIPVGGNLKVEDGAGVTVFSVDIPDYGPGVVEFPRPKVGAAVNTALIVTLAAGGAGVTGKISVLNHWLV